MSLRFSIGSWWMGVLLMAAGGLVIAQFVVPPKQDRVSAAGALDGLDPAMRRAFSDRGEFEAKSAPEPGDWLAQHKEAGQTFGQYVRAKPNRPDERRGVIYILPVGEFDDRRAPSLPLLRRFAAAYYAPLSVWTLPAVAEAEVKARSRVNELTGRKQWNSEDILTWLLGRLPKDAYAMIAVTMTDLYPKDSWNYVFGQAMLRQRVGVFSFARYDPRFWGEKAGKATEALMLQRAAKVLTHETGHMFGLPHCIYYECNMNGSNSLPETDRAPMHLCPVCLRKLHHAIGFDPLVRYRGLRAIAKECRMTEEVTWLDKRIEAIEAAE